MSTLLQNGHFPIFSLFWRAFFVTIAAVKLESIPYFYTLAIVLINSYEETPEERFLFFDLIGCQNSLLMHVPLFYISHMLKRS